jgi:hypothetical protein
MTTTNDAHDRASSRTPAAQAHRSRRRAALRFAGLELRPDAWAAVMSEDDRVDELRQDLAAVFDGPTMALLRAALPRAPR